MTKPHSLRVAFSAVVFFAMAGITSAQDVGLKPQTSPEGIEYVAGGIGTGQRDALKAMRNEYNLRLSFARPQSGDYLADVKVLVENKQKEKVLDVVSSGPILYAKVPAGTYKVTAMYDNQKITKTATIRNGGARGLTYYFPKQ